MPTRNIKYPSLANTKIKGRDTRFFINLWLSKRYWNIQTGEKKNTKERRKWKIKDNEENTKRPLTTQGLYGDLRRHSWNKASRGKQEFQTPSSDKNQKSPMFHYLRRDHFDVMQFMVYFICLAQWRTYQVHVDVGRSMIRPASFITWDRFPGWTSKKTGTVNTTSNCTQTHFFLF